MLEGVEDKSTLHNMCLCVGLGLVLWISWLWAWHVQRSLWRVSEFSSSCCASYQSLYFFCVHTCCSVTDS